MGLLADTEGMSCLRWVLVLPAGLVTWVVVGNLILWLPTLGQSDDGQRDDDPLARIARIGLALVAPSVLIYVTTRIAPTRRLYVAGAAGLVWSLYFYVKLAVSLQSGTYNSSADWLELAAVVVLAIVSLVVGFALVDSRLDKGKERPLSGEVSQRAN